MKITILLAFALTTLKMTGQNTSIVYVGDPMCSWCYGISEELSEFRSSNPDIPFEVIVGGLRAGGGEEWNQEFRDFLRHHWEDVHQASGMPFSYQLLDRPTFNYDTEPACRSVVVAQDMTGGDGLDFFKAVQKKFYFDNEDPNMVEFYRSICDELGLSFGTFKQKFKSDDFRMKTEEQFEMAGKLGVRSFPTILVRQGDTYQVIGSGYASSKQLQRNLEKVLK